MKLPLFLAHGGELIPILFIGFPAAFLGLVFLVLALVEKFERKPPDEKRRTKAYSITAIVLWAIALGSPTMLPLIDWFFEQVETAAPTGPRKPVVLKGEPTIIAPEKVPAMISKLPDHVGFGYSGAAYFQGKLYVSSNIGLLTIKDHRFESLLQWTKSDAVIEGPWFDGANQALWAQAANDGSLLRFDGTHWTRMPLPEPPKGYTRGDMLDGFGGRSTPRAFWVMGGNCIWRWEPGGNSWSTEALPTMPAGSAVKAFLNWDDSKIFLVREGYQIGIEAGNNPATVHVLDKEWSKFAGIDIDAESTAQTNRFGYVRSRDGQLFQLTRSQMIKLDGPGRCEAITTTSKGTLLASFGPVGVYERVDDLWVKRADSPLGSGEGEHWAHLAESDGEIALATSQVPQMVSGTDKFVHSGTAGIWITRNGAFERVDGQK